MLKLAIRVDPRLRRPRAFTLIEVLVVVAIIALLVAMLIPTLQAARRRARCAACLANMKSIGSSLGMYTNAHRGWLPVGPADRLVWQDPVTGYMYRDFAGGRRQVPVASCGWGGKRGTVPHDWDDRPEDMKRPLTDFLYKKAGLDSEMPLFQCPDDVGIPKRYESGWVTSDQTNKSMYTVCGNSYYINPWDLSKPVSNARRYKNTGSMIVAEEALMMFSMEWPAKQLTSWHGQFSRHNLLFLDFHASNTYVNPELAKSQTDPHRWQGPGWFAVNYFEIMDFYR